MQPRTHILKARQANKPPKLKSSHQAIMQKMTDQRLAQPKMIYDKLKHNYIPNPACSLVMKVETKPLAVPQKVKSMPVQPTVRKVSVVPNKKSVMKNEITLLNKLGEGGFGTVYKALWGHKTVAVKVPNPGCEDCDLQEFENEVGRIKKIAHLQLSNVVEFYGASLIPNKYSIIMQYMPMGSLRDIIHLHPSLLTPTVSRSIIVDMIKGLDALHGEGIVHRDLKSHNILLDANLHAVIADLGSSVQISTGEYYQSYSPNTVGTPGWIAPECYANKIYSSKSDYYSLGVVIWEMFSHKVPQIHHFVGPGVALEILVIQGGRETIPEDCPKELAHLIRWCWNSNPNNRPNKNQCLAYLESEAKMTPR